MALQSFRHARCCPVSYTHLTYQEAELPELGEGEAIGTSIPADPNVKNLSLIHI